MDPVSQPHTGPSVDGGPHSFGLLPPAFEGLQLLTIVLGGGPFFGATVARGGPGTGSSASDAGGAGLNHDII